MKIEQARPRSPRYLSEQERIRIADLLAAKVSVRGIALELGRAPSTISREIRRNRDADGRYRSHHAEHAARRRASRPRERRIAGDGVLAEVVQLLLSKRWSPEQVAHELRLLFAGQPSRWLCKETIYQAIYDTAVALTRPVRRRRRRRQLHGLQRRGRLTAMRMIDERPAEVQDRVQAGHWEGDLIMGAGNRSAIGTLVERTTRYVILLAFPDGIASTDAVRQAITDALERVPAGLRRTLTWDQGKELAQHLEITAATRTGVFFCDAHSPWQRGSNENMNGLLRDYFPKRTDLGIHTAEHLAAVAAEVNERPRKTLGGAGQLTCSTASSPLRSHPVTPPGVLTVLKRPSPLYLAPRGSAFATTGALRCSGRRESPARLSGATASLSSHPSVATLAGFPTSAVGPLQTAAPKSVAPDRRQDRHRTVRSAVERVMATGRHASANILGSLTTDRPMPARAR